jgi:oxygen-independent coproporphyrinogen-3 oxidase
MTTVPRPFGLYVHIPFCAKKCPYCDFNSYARESQDGGLAEEKEYTKALISELRHFAKSDNWSGRSISSIFFGGGTPSLFSSRAISSILEVANELFPFCDDVETTLEANPGSLQEELALERLKGFRRGGVNRISLGAQSFSNRKLKLLGRLHSAEDNHRALELIAAAGFDNMSLDLIFAVPEETPDEWQNDLSTALTFPVNHISAYGLTIEPGTEFYKREKRGTFAALNEDMQEILFRMTQKSLGEAGFEQYEISNYAKTKHECKHNLAYWQGVDYLGVGAGAHSYQGHRKDSSNSSAPLFGQRWINILKPQSYMERVNAEGTAIQRAEDIDEDKALLEFFFLGLRTKQGISISKFNTLFGEPLDTRYRETLSELVQFELLSKNDDYWSLSSKGTIMLDSVLEKFATS